MMTRPCGLKTTVLLATVLLAVATGKANETAEASGASSATVTVNPSLFIKNVMARAEETMNTSADDYSDILLDVMQMEGIDCNPPHGIKFDTKTGEISQQNTLENLDVFRKIVADLNRDDGVRSYPPTNGLAKAPLLITGRFYKMTTATFEKLAMGKPAFRGNAKESAWWELSPEGLVGLKAMLKAAGAEPFQTGRIQTVNGVSALLYAGDRVDHIEFKCLPISIALTEGKPFSTLKVQAATTGKFSSDPAGDWPVFAGRTNCAAFARVTAPWGGGILFRLVNGHGVPLDNLVVLVEVTTPSNGVRLEKVVHRKVLKP